MLTLTRLLLHHQARAMLEPSMETQSASEAAVRRMRDGDPDGAIATGSLGLLREMGTWGVPAVHVGDVPDDVHVCRVHVDNELGGRLAGEHRWSLCHRHIRVLQVPYGTCAEKRLDAIGSVWRSHGGDIGDDRALCVSAAAYGEVAAGLRPMLQGVRDAEAPLTALFCNSDWLASVCLRALRDVDLRVPQDISVVGFDDSQYSELLSPPLTTIRRPFPALGATAVELLLEQAADRPLDKAYVLPCGLIARASTAPPPETGNPRPRHPRSSADASERRAPPDAHSEVPAG